MEGRTALRIDKFLYFARLAKTRGRAQEMLREGNPRLDGRPLSSLHGEIRPGQVLTLADRDRLRAIEVLALPDRRGPAPEARACYVDKLAPSPIDGATG